VCNNYLDDLHQIAVNAPVLFNETLLFNEKENMYKFKKSFRNISRIMDCVGCEKCRLWGKLQITGIATALKIIFSFKSLLFY